MAATHRFPCDARWQQLLLLAVLLQAFARPSVATARTEEGEARVKMDGRKGVMQQREEKMGKRKRKGRGGNQRSAGGVCAGGVSARRCRFCSAPGALPPAAPRIQRRPPDGHSSPVCGAARLPAVVLPPG
ncbi:hypothetical protein PVAP13_8NG196101 [Panicum virgatum]|uniref:Uncharacterized protein n=1 Tax=Panicum virgatum TaxID=38727 RepID=A0A8T0P6H7_PANVG|nr:hypothetical protein PVAP13_8NG196101 [Panicum virgatum]KAG2556598.1 hypothetical protein PVAP13_8NG196101 [Panicum virgatum]